MAMYGETNLFDLFEMGQTTEQPGMAEKEKKAVAESVREGNSVSEELDDSDALGSFNAAAQKSSKKTSVKSNSVTGKTKIKLPLTVYGRNFKVHITDLEDPTYNGLVHELVKQGYKEVASSKISLVPFEGNVLITSPKSQTPESVLCQLDGGSVTVCTGMLQAEYSAEQFSGFDLDEISLEMIHEKWSEINPDYTIHGLCYDVETGIILPYINGAPAARFELPVTINCCGERAVINPGPMLKAELALEEVKEYLGFSKKTPLIFKKLGNEYVLQFLADKTIVKDIDRTAYIQNKGACEKKAVVNYTLPLSVYFATLGITVKMESDMFGKPKVTRDDIINKMKESFSILRSEDRIIETFYHKENNTFSVALTSGKKGSSYVLPEYTGSGLFKLIHSLKEFQDCINQSSYLGYYHDHNVGRRLESSPVAAFIGIMGRGRECTQIKSVEFIYKLPKIPRKIFDTVCRDFKFHPTEERILQIYWDEHAMKYIVAVPDESKASQTSIQYTFKPRPKHMKLVLTIHSHNIMAPYFSCTDDEDELLTGFYGVVGTVDKTPTATFRVGMEGVFTPIAYTDLFEEE